MAFRYITKEGDMLDEIVFQYYGDANSRGLEIVLDANPDLADEDLILPEGVEIILPEIKNIKTKGVRLWE